MSYVPSGAEIDIFEAASRQQLAVLLKGPTGCGKTRFVEEMAKRLGRPLYSVACHDDLSAADLIGRFLIHGGETVWQDGPLTRAVREGGICYLDEIAEARSDTTVVIHPLSDHRRQLSIERTGEILSAPPGFMLVLSINPAYQSVLKELKPSTRQRMVTIALDFPGAAVEARIVAGEGGVALDVAERLVGFAGAIRMLKKEGLSEGASTRTLISAAKLIAAGLSPARAAAAAIVEAVSDDVALTRPIGEMIPIYLPDET